MANNYDQSSIGFSVDISIFYDTDQSRQDFNNNIKQLKHGLCFFTDWGNYNEDQIIEVGVDCNYQIITVTGYIQGDIAKVVVLDKIIESYSCDNPIDIIKKGITHYFYDAPINANITIDGDDQYLIGDYLVDSYEWDKDKFLINFFDKQNFSSEEERVIRLLTPENINHI